jgi:hypothetical protein
MKKAIGTVYFLCFAATIWLGGPVAAIAFSAAFRPDYEVREFANEFEARLRPNRVYWQDFKAYRMDCPGEKNRRVVVLQTLEFEEAAADYLARTHPDCTNFVHERDDSWPGVKGILVGRW